MINSKELEKVTEEKPELVQNVLPNTPIAEEAKQITEDKDKRNDEVSNDAVNDTLSGLGSSFIDWDKVKVYKPGEDPYLSVHEGYDPRVEANNEYEYPEEEKHAEEVKDEDFLGPDEYIDENGNIQVDPNWKPENADEDFVGPDEQLAVINNGLPAEISYEPVYDTPDYNFDWEAVVETLPPDLQEDMESLPDEDKEEISRLLHINLGKIKSKGINAPTPSSGSSNPDIDMGETPHSSSTVHRPGTSMLGMTLVATDAPIRNDTNKPERIDSVNSIASAGPIPPEEAKDSSGKLITSASNNSVPRGNGSVGSGAGFLFSKVGMLKSEKSAPEIPMLGHTSEVPELQDIQTQAEDLKEGIIKSIEDKLNANPEQAEAMGFDHKHKHWSFNGITLDEMSFAQLTELNDKLGD